MRMRTMILTVAFGLAMTGIAKADDHLFQAKQKGLRQGSTALSHSHAFTTNRSGHSGTLAPGQGSPFTGHDRQTPATDTSAAKAHARIKPRTPR